MTSLFKQRDTFDAALRQKVDTYFKSNNKKQTGDVRLYTKAAFSFVGFIATYVGLLTVANGLWSTTIWLFLFVQFNILIAFNIMHDSGHQAFSSKNWLNKLAIRIWLCLEDAFV